MQDVHREASQSICSVRFCSRRRSGRKRRMHEKAAVRARSGAPAMLMRLLGVSYLGDEASLGEFHLSLFLYDHPLSRVGISESQVFDRSGRGTTNKLD